MQKAYPPNNRINKPICTLEKLKTFHESHRKKETWPRPGSKLRGEGQGRFPLENAVGARMASEESTCRVACLLPAIREALDKNVFFPARKKKKKSNHPTYSTNETPPEFRSASGKARRADSEPAAGL